ncbi:ABC transporter permease [Actinomadura macrotermitis]|uniref:ABC3 transporter permease C-terminal domain-containing protein n=1 Tax=Actinomadura macrotermitis TaxID=2585200 RepID=A0A7K0BX97_9ACTN|nr:FtsX-like permease family protein [Actinomadura macrotermitis]MQY05813.1 hypothetical protein [Actinomadura macrotermitis]
MISFALHALRHRKASFAGAFAALFCAAAMICACGTLMTTGLAGHARPGRYAGAPVIVAGDPESHFLKDKGDGEFKRKSKPNTARAWIPAALAERIRSVPGVERAVPEVSVPVLGPDGKATGHGWESAALTPVALRAGRAPRAAGEIVVARGRVGARLRVLTPAGPGAYTVVGVSRQNAGVFFSTGEAARLAARPGQVTAIGVWPAGAAKAVRDAVGGAAVVRTGDGRGQVEFLGVDAARTRLISMGAALGGTSLLVALLAVTGTFGITVQQRERELALLRAVAATPRQVRRLIGGEALLVGVLAAVPGALAGLPLGAWLHGRFVGLGAVPAELPLVLGPFAPLAAVAATVPAAWIAARVSARRVARLRPVEALGEAALTPGRTPWLRVLAGLAAVAAGVVLTLVLTSVHSDAASGPLTPLTALAWTTAITLLGPLLARCTLGLIPAGGLVAANLRADTRRTAAVLGPLTLMIALSGTLMFAETTVKNAAAEQARAGTRASHVLGPMTAAQAAELRRRPGVRAVTQVLRTRVRAIGSPYSAQGVTTEGLGETMDLKVVSGTLADLREGTAAVRTHLGKKVGDTLAIAMADGTPVRLRVVAVYERGLGFGDLTLPYPLVAAHVDVPMGTALVAAPGVKLTGTAVRAASRENSGSAVNYLSLGLIVAFAGITMVNTLALAVAGRSRELALLRLAGSSRRQVLRTLRFETLAVVLLAAALGGGIAFVTLTGFGAGMTGSSPAFPPGVFAGIVAAAGALALAATALPARAALRAAPAAVLGARE